MIATINFRWLGIVLTTMLLYISCRTAQTPVPSASAPVPTDSSFVDLHFYQKAVDHIRSNIGIRSHLTGDTTRDIPLVLNCRIGFPAIELMQFQRSILDSLFPNSSNSKKDSIEDDLITIGNSYYDRYKSRRVPMLKKLNTSKSDGRIDSSGYVYMVDCTSVDSSLFSEYTFLWCSVRLVKVDPVFLDEKVIEHNIDNSWVGIFVFDTLKNLINVFSHDNSRNVVRRAMVVDDTALSKIYELPRRRTQLDEMRFYTEIVQYIRNDSEAKKYILGDSTKEMKFTVSTVLTCSQYMETERIVIDWLVEYLYPNESNMDSLQKIIRAKRRSKGQCIAHRDSLLSNLTTLSSQQVLDTNFRSYTLELSCLHENLFPGFIVAFAGLYDYHRSELIGAPPYWPLYHWIAIYYADGHRKEIVSGGGPEE